MKNYFKLLSLSSLCLLTACEKSDDQVIQKDTADFFNLKVGNYWVYKNYAGDAIQNIEFSNSLDSVVITDKFTFDKKDYFKMETFYNKLNINDLIWKSANYFYINTKGYLIKVEEDPREKNNQKEYVMHPGVDKDFTFQQEIVLGGELYGIVNYKLENNKTINVEGKDYVSYPYIGRLPANEKIKKELVSEYHYTKGVGMVKEVLAAISGDVTFERHLVSYKN